MATYSSEVITKLYSTYDIELKEYCYRSSDLCFKGCSGYANRALCYKHFKQEPVLTDAQIIRLITLILRSSKDSTFFKISKGDLTCTAGTYFVQSNEGSCTHSTELADAIAAHVLSLAHVIDHNLVRIALSEE